MESSNNAPTGSLFCRVNFCRYYYTYFTWLQEALHFRTGSYTLAASQGRTYAEIFTNIIDMNLDLLLNSNEYQNLCIKVDQDFDQDSGIIFLYCDWSPVIEPLQNILNCLTTCPCLKLYIYDIDKQPFREIQKRFGLKSNGWGETFWIHNRRIKHEILRHVDNELKLIEDANSMLSVLTDI